MSGERFSLFLSERDRFGELEAVWSFPSTTTAQQQLLLEHCEHRSQSGSLAEDGDSFVVKVGANEWYYSLRLPVRRLEQNIDCLECCLSLITTSSYNRVKYENVLKLLLELYMESGNPTKMVEAVMNFQAKGSFQSLNLKSFEFIPTSVGSMLEVVKDYGMDMIVLYNAILLKKRVLVIGDEQRQVMTVLETLPQFAVHRKDAYDQSLRPIVLSNSVHLEDLSQAGYWIASMSESSYANVNMDKVRPDVTVNLSDKRITVAPYALNSMKLCDHHRTVSSELVQQAEQDQCTSAELIKTLSLRNSELLEKLKAVAAGAAGNFSEESFRTEEVGKESMQSFCIRVAVAEGLL